MKNLVLLALVGCLCLFACNEEAIVPSEAITTRTYNFPEISAILATEDFEVFYTFGNGPQSVEVETSENLQNRVDITESNGQLNIGLEDNLNIRGNQTFILRLHTTAPITDFHVNSDAVINIQTPLNVTNLSLQASSDGSINGNLLADIVELDASSDAEISLTGEANRLIASLNSDATVKSFDFFVNHLEIELSSNAEAELSVLGILDARANSDALLRYQGDPEIIRQETSSNGRIEKVE